MDTKARDLAAVFKRASKDGILEQPFREPVEEHLIALAKAEKIVSPAPQGSHQGQLNVTVPRAQ